MPLQSQKRIMAIAGLIMTVYLVFHMLTNLSFFSPDNFTSFYDSYNAGTRWLVLAVMFVTIIVHVKVAITIRKVNAKARTLDYARHDKFKLPAYIITISIIFLLLFIVIHIVQALFFDVAQLHGELVTLFQSPFMLLFYLAGLFFLTMHLQHSLANVLQTLGKTSVVNHRLVWVSVLVVTGGFSSIPLYIYFGSNLV